MEKMDKKKLWSLGILIPVFITAILIVMTLVIGGSGGIRGDSSGIPFASFFAIFVLPGIIAHQKQKRKQKELAIVE